MFNKKNVQGIYMNIQIRLLLIVFSILSFTIGSVNSEPKKMLKEEAKNNVKDYQSKFNQQTDQLNLTSKSGLNEYLKLASVNNPGLKSSFYLWKSDLEKTGYAGALPDPVLMYGYFIENVETRVGPQNQKFSIRQMIPWFGTLGDKKNIAFEMSNVSFKKFEADMLKLFYQVKDAYYDFYYLGREIEITKENIELLKFWESVVRTKYKVALTQHPDVIKAQVELGVLEDRLLTLEDKIRPTKARLIAVLNVPEKTEIPIPEQISINESNIEENKYIQDVINNNPNLAAIKHMIEKENHAINLANKSSLPNFTFGIDYIETGEALNPLMAESGKDPLVASVGINIPLWFGKNNSKKNEAKAKKKSAEYLLTDKENQLTAVTENIIFQHNDALRKIQLYRDGLIPKAEQSLNASYTSYQAGKADFLNVLDAQRQLLNFQLMLDMSKTMLAKRKAELDMLTGIELQE